MWNFIIIWCLATSVLDAPTVIKDEFDRETIVYPTTYHIEYDCNHSKTFKDRKEAFAFYNKAIKENTEFKTGINIIDCKPSNVKIDSILIK